jgi:hypothetical protein
VCSFTLEGVAELRWSHAHRPPKYLRTVIGKTVRLSLWNHPGDTIYGMFAHCESSLEHQAAKH